MSTRMSSSEMDQPMAQRLFKQGATLVLIGVPAGTEFGFDCMTWIVGKKFCGVKMIPPGMHFVYYSAVGRDHQVAPRTAFFYNFQQGEVLVRHWDKGQEELSLEDVSTEEQERVQNNKNELDKGLGPYPYDQYKKWVSLSNHIDRSVMKQLMPQCGKISAVTPLISQGSTTESRRAAAEAAKTSPAKVQDSEDSRLPHMPAVPGTEVCFTEIPKKKYPDGATPEEITHCSMDHSYVLELLINSCYKDSPLKILGELQFAFVCFLFGQVFDGFEQWKQLVHLLSSCDEAIQNHTDLFTQFISVMHFHLQEIPEDFFVDIVSQDNFLTTTLHSFFQNLHDSGADAKLKSRGAKFQGYLKKKFHWDFSQDDDEDAPMVVK